MPIYGYSCQKCGRTFQTLVRSGETPACPSCGSEQLAQQLSLIATPAKQGTEAPMCEGGMGACGSCCGMGGCD
jgi:putative FmdB family regulatory protein